MIVDFTKYFSSVSKILVFPHCGSVLGYISKVSKLLPITHWGRSPNASNWRPIMAERPETVEALASAKPPPRRRTNDQGIFLWMASQVKRLGDGLDSEAKNRRKSLLLSTFVMKLKRSRYYAASAKDNGNYVRKSFQANWKYTDLLRKAKILALTAKWTKGWQWPFRQLRHPPIRHLC